MNARSFSSVQRVAHRGGAALAPENSLAAFRQALALPIDVIELDVQMSRDGHAIVFHDETVERLTSGQGNLLDLDFADLQALDVAANFLGGWPQPQRIPTLREVLELARQGHIQVYIEIKSSKHAHRYRRYPGIAEAVVQEVLATDMLAHVMIMSFDWEILPQIKALAPSTQTGTLVSQAVWQPQATGALSILIEQISVLQCEWVHMDYKLFTPKMPAFFHTHGLQLGVWTVNDAEGLQRLARLGVDALTTDRPDLFATASD
ncbi:MAG: glycerophosphodiester phosphodiesterase [Ktedonobacteraceae bacterium]